MHFGYDSVGRLLQIRVPHPGGVTASYDFAGRDPLGRLHWIALALNGAHQRVTWLDFFGADAAVDLIHDPDGQHVHFWYADAQNPYRVTERRERGSVVRVGYGYDAAGKLTWARTYMDTTAAHGDIVAGFEAVESRGVAHAAGTTFASVGASQTYTRLDGPRTDVTDHTWLWVGRWGAPARIRDALGGETVITRGNVNFPALATAVVGPSGFRSTAAYDTAGRVVQITEVNPQGDGVDRTVTYAWDERWDKPDTIRAPGVGETRMAYDTLTGNLRWQEVGGSNRRTWFDYHASGTLAGLLARVRYPDPVTGATGDGGSDSLAYDAVGNLRMTRTPLGFLSVHVRDALGRDTLTVTPIDTTHARNETQLLLHGARQRTEYDVMDRPWRMTTLGPQVTHTAGAEGWIPKPSLAEQLVVTTTYNGLGQPLGILRESSPYESEQYTAYTYDAAGRKVVELTGTVTQRFAYDPAGNVVTATTGRGHQITTRHDALGRMTRRSVPSVTAAAQCVTLPGMYGCRQFPLRPNSGTGYLIPEETSFFRYDVAGAMVYAENRDAIVARGYYPGGALRTDSLWLRAYDGLSFSQHAYGLEYRYDAAGRAAALVHPTNLAVSGAQRDTFAYDTVTGALFYARDRIGNLFTFQYDLLGRPVATRMPGMNATELVEGAEYDADSRLVRRTLGSTTSPSGLMDERMLHDARGKIMRVTFPNGTASTQRQWYSGLGNLAATEWDNDGGAGYEREAYVLDGLGNIREKRTVPQVSDYPHDYHMLYTLDPVNGRVTEILRRDTLSMQEPFLNDSTSRLYDGSGNMWMGTQQREVGSGTHYSLTRSYFGADDRLRATQVVDEPTAGGNAGVWEEYRYDPLGRRVLVRSVRQGNTAPPGAPYSLLLCGTTSCRSSVTRYVWAGDQVLWELRAPGADTDNLESTTSAGATEPRFYGRVSYLHAGGIDRPLSIWKDGVGSVRPHENWRGQFARGTWGVGPLQGKSSDCAYGGAPDCIPLQWPGYRTNAWHQQSAGDPEYWMGSLVDGMRDPTGQIYMRNRMYDPQTGQFTQPDPIGIAGGLNASGFAAGDPVSFADPYGLKIDWGGEDVSPEDKRRAQRVWNDMARRVNAAQHSSDPEIRAAALALGRMLRSMWDDPNRVYTILVNNDPNFVGRDGGGLESPAGSGRRLIQITDESSQFTSMLPWMTLAHELGGANSTIRGGRHARPAVQAENWARTIVGCQHRNRAHRWDQFEFGNPTCKR